jgi:(p)ppGpp synthase/HD superfamily hydrolase
LRKTFFHGTCQLFYESESVFNMATTIATPRFLDALSYAVQLHSADVRKGTSVPYIAHLLSVCALVLLDGGTEEEAIAGLLHDALEDHPDTTSRDVIAERFGQTVLTIVEGCTDTPPDYKGGAKPPWKGRKSEYLEHLKGAGPKERRVSLADKLDNARSTLADYRALGEALWSRFNAGKDDQLWFYRSLKEAFRAVGATGFLLEEFERTVSEIEKLAGPP